MEEYSRIFRECYELLEKSSIDAINRLNEIAKSEFEKDLVIALTEEINRNRKKYKDTLAKCYVYFAKYKNIINDNGAWIKVVFTMQSFSEDFERAVAVAIIIELEQLYKKNQEAVSTDLIKTSKK